MLSETHLNKQHKLWKTVGSNGPGLILTYFPSLNFSYHSSAMCMRLFIFALRSCTSTITLLTRRYSAPSSVVSAPGRMKGRWCGMVSGSFCSKQVCGRMGQQAVVSHCLEQLGGVLCSSVCKCCCIFRNTHAHINTHSELLMEGLETM